MVSTMTTASQDAVVQFEVLPAKSEADARLGRLHVRDRKSIETPHYLAISSRGTVPHITQDLMRDQTSISAIYTAIEDYAEKVPKPISLLSFPCSETESPLRRFIALQNDALLILGPRRLPPVPGSTFNTATDFQIFTSVGYRRLEVATYIDAAKRARPDIVVGVADIEFGKPTPGRKRIDRMDERTLAWIRGFQRELSSHQHSTGHHLTSLWAPLLPVERELQRSYMEYLEEQPASCFGGVALYENDSLPNIPSNLQPLPRLIMNSPQTPHALLTSISLGADLLTIPFINVITEAGQAFQFKFPCSSSSSRLPLAADLWSAEHNTAMQSLVPGCQCYTCSTHHRAYIHHLLQAKEMLAWVLLQIHNHAMVDKFFMGIRQSLANGTFEQDMEAFGRTYSDEFPAIQGEGPRIRGFHKSNVVGEGPRNRKRYRRLESPNGDKVPMRDEGAAKLEESEDAGLFTSNERHGEPGFAQLFQGDMEPEPSVRREDRKP